MRSWLGPRGLMAVLASIGGCHLVVGVGELDYLRCEAPEDCPSGACFDGYCCDRACAGDCEACNVSGFEGTCTPSPAGTADCASGAGVCDGAGRCARGEVVWLQRLGGAGDQQATGVACDGTRVFVGGSFGGTIFNQTAAETDENGFVGVLDAGNGSYQDGDSAALYDNDAGANPQAVGAMARHASGVAIAGHCRGAVGYLVFEAACDENADDAFLGVVNQGLGPTVSQDPFPFALTSSGGVQRATGVAAAQQGNVAVCGSFDGTLGDLTANGVDGFVGVYTPTSEKIWAAALGTDGNSAAHAVAVDTQGRVVVVGEYQGGFGLGSVPRADGGTRAFVSVFDPTGEHVWSAGFGSDGANQSAFGVAVNHDDEIVVAGGFGGSIELDKMLTSAGGSDVFVALLAPDGTPRWSLQLGDDLDQAAHAVAVDDRGAIAVAGGFAGHLQDAASTGGEDAFVLKIAHDGTLLWLHADGSPQHERATSVAVDPSGAIYAAGWADAFLDFGALDAPLAAEGRDAFVVKWAP